MLLTCSLCYMRMYHAISSPYHEETKSDTLWAVFQGQGSVVVVVFRLDWGVVQHRSQQVDLRDFLTILFEEGEKNPLLCY